MKRNKKTERIEIRVTAETKKELKTIVEKSNCKSSSEYLTRVIKDTYKNQDSSIPLTESSHESHVQSALMLNHILNLINGHPDSTPKLKDTITKEVQSDVFR